MIDRRSFFRVLASVAALPIVAKLPAPARRVVERTGAWATVRIEAGAITAIVITSAGKGYETVPTITFTGPQNAVSIDPTRADL